MNEEFEKQFNSIYKKYQFKNYNNDINTNIISEIDNYINLLTNTKSYNIYKICKNIKNENNIYISDRLKNFFNKNECSINNSIINSNLFNIIINLVEKYNFRKVRNLDDDIYYELKKISNSKYSSKKLMIDNFIKKYTSINQSINIKI
uniref:Uncharacterized protein n=1 Tax=viral metagenome TaxID=1070528 RepID=A0A6C0H0N7_9ZZZZ